GTRHPWPGRGERAELGRIGPIAVLSVLVGATAGLSGCTASPNGQEASSASSSAEVDILQGRTDYTRGVFSMSVTNAGAEPMTVETATFTSPQFSAPAVYDAHPVTIRPGATIDLRSPIPALDCAGDDSAGSVALVLSSGTGSTTVEVTPGDPNNTIDRLVREGCIVHDVDAVVTIAPPTALVVTGDGAAATARIDLRLTPTGDDGTVEIAGVRSTTLMSPVDGSDGWPLDLTVDAATDPRTVSLGMRPTRCDPHALADDKVGTVLVIDVATSTGRDGRYLLPLPPAVKAQVFDYIVAVCGD
ncbi:MAG: hypothetical protein ABWX82_12925, partial [Leifsonia sp.]